MNSKDYENKIFTIPNILSMVRILLVPVFATLYFWNFEGHFYWAIGALILSGISDVADGTIARHFNMISNFGKIIDPLADKLTQGVAVICIAVKHPSCVPLLILFCAKECTMLLGSYHLLKSGARPSESKWWGKLSTVMMFAFLVVVLISDIIAVPNEIIACFEVIAAICLLFSLFNYYPVFKEIQTGEYDLETESKVKNDNDKAE